MKKALIIAAIFAVGLAAQAQTNLVLSDSFNSGLAFATNDLNYNLVGRQAGSSAQLDYYEVFTNFMPYTTLTAEGELHLESYRSTSTEPFDPKIGTNSFSIKVTGRHIFVATNQWIALSIQSATNAYWDWSPIGIRLFNNGDIDCWYGSAATTSSINRSVYYVTSNAVATAIGGPYDVTANHTFEIKTAAQSATNGTYGFYVDGAAVAAGLPYLFGDDNLRFAWVPNYTNEVPWFPETKWDDLEVNTIPTPEWPVSDADDMVLYRSGSWFMHETEPAPNYLDPDGAAGDPASVDSTAGWGGYVGDLPMVGDVNGDGIDDIVINREEGVNYRWLAGHTINTNGIQIGSQAFPSHDSTALLGDTNSISGNRFLADVDGDGTDDAVCVYADFNFGAFTSSSNGLGTGAWQGFLQCGLAGDQPIMGDFNGDGADDPGVYRQAGGNIYWKDAVGTNGWGSGELGPVGQIGGGATDSLLVGDLNGDGFDDAVMVRTGVAGGLLQWFGLINDGTGFLDYFNPGTTIVSFGLDDGVDTPMLADINGDGMDDIVINRGGTFWYSTFTTAGGALGVNAAGDANANFGLADDVPLFGRFSAPVVDVILDNITLNVLSGGSDLTLTWATSLGTDYTVEIKTNLVTDVNWTSNSAVLGTGGDVTHTTGVDNAQLFYRVTAP